MFYHDMRGSSLSENHRYSLCILQSIQEQISFPVELNICTIPHIARTLAKLWKAGERPDGMELARVGIFRTIHTIHTVILV